MQSNQAVFAQSLFVLSQVVEALRTGGGKRVPYRDSKLTRFLQVVVDESAPILNVRSYDF
jgi:hypothetical protein